MCYAYNLKVQAVIFSVLLQIDIKYFIVGNGREFRLNTCQISKESVLIANLKVNPTH